MTSAAAGPAPPTRAAPAPAGGLLRSNLVVALGTFLSRVTGYGRLLALTAALSQTTLTDAYNVANNSPNQIYELVLGGILTATLVPLFVEHFEQDDDDATNALISTAFLVLVALTGVAILAAPWIVRLYAVQVPDAEASAFITEATRLARLFLPQILFYGLTALGTALLNARRRFAVPAIAPVLNNLVVIAVLLAVPVVFEGDLTLQRALDDDALTWTLGLGATAGIVAMTLALWPAVRLAGVRLRFRPDFRHPAVRAMVRLSGWTFGYVVANQVALVVISILALRDEGALSSYQAAFILFQLPHGLLAVSLMTTLAPDLASSASRRDHRRFAGRFTFGTRLLALAVFPAAAGYIALSRPIVSVLLEYGALDEASAQRTANVLVAFAFGLGGFSLYLFVLRAFYARRDTRTPFYVNLFENALNIVLALVLVDRFGVVGLAAAFGIAYLVAAGVALVLLGGRVPTLDVGRLVGALVRTALAAALMGLVVWWVAERVGGDQGVDALVRVAVGIVVGVVTYVAAVFGFRWLELRLAAGRGPQERAARPSPGRR